MSRPGPVRSSRARGRALASLVLVVDARDARRVTGRCEAAGKELGRLLPIRSASGAVDSFDAVAGNVARVGRAVATLQPSFDQKPSPGRCSDRSGCS